MKLRHTAALAAIVVLIAGCGSQNSPDKVADVSCSVSAQNAEQICLMAGKDKSMNESGTAGMGAEGEETLVSKNLQQNANTSTIRIEYSVRTPKGELAAEVLCGLNPHRSVVYANLEKGPTSKEQADYLLSQGLCSN